MRVSGNLVLSLAGAELAATAEGALAWPDEHLLIVADLHLEKGSSFARRRMLLPPYDTAATLLRLSRAIARFSPRRVVFLGDTFHDCGAHARVAPSDRDALKAMLARRDIVWISGNHDPDPPPDLPGDARADLEVGSIHFRHEPSITIEGAEIAGHLHPVARVMAQGRVWRRRCYAGDGRRVVLPAFGAYAGGLNVRDEAFQPLFPKGLTAHVMGEEQVFAFAWRRCLGD